MSARRPFAQQAGPGAQRFNEYGEAGRRSLAEPFRGITTDGDVVPGLFSVESTGVSTQAVLEAANAFLASLDPPQRDTATFGIDDEAWRAWSNIHPFVMRHGVALDTTEDALARDGTELFRGRHLDAALRGAAHDRGRKGMLAAPLEARRQLQNRRFVVTAHRLHRGQSRGRSAESSAC